MTVLAVFKMYFFPFIDEVSKIVIPEKEEEYAELASELENPEEPPKRRKTPVKFQEVEKEYTQVTELENLEPPQPKKFNGLNPGSQLTGKNAHTKTLELMAQIAMTNNEFQKQQAEFQSRQQDLLSRALDIQERYMPKKNNV